MRRWVFLWALTAAPLMAAAEPRVILQQHVETTTFEGFDYASYNDPAAAGKTALSHYISPPGDSTQSSYAAGDLSAGTLKVETRLREYYYGGFARGYVTLEDTFVLSNTALGQVGHLNYLLNGEFVRGAPQDPFRVEEYKALLTVRVDYGNPVSGARASWERNAILSDGKCGGYHYANQTCVDGMAIDLTGLLDIPLQAGNYSFVMSLQIDTALGWDANFGHTARAYFGLPDGVTLQSGSGVLFQTAAPIPEPQTWALMACGIALVCTAVGRRSRSS